MPVNHIKLCLKCFARGPNHTLPTHFRTLFVDSIVISYVYRFMQCDFGL